jgi:hypothetical protein
MGALFNITSFGPEHTLSIPTAGSGVQCLAISGYAQDPGNLRGNKDDDSDYEKYTVTMTIGPEWTAVRDVCPMVTVTGFAHHDSDEADATGYQIPSCSWTTVPGQSPSTVRIQLSVELWVMGGNEGYITTLAYHVIAVGV